MPSLLVSKSYLRRLSKDPKIIQCPDEAFGQVIDEIVSTNRIELEGEYDSTGRKAEGVSATHVRFEVPANRPDLCCAEGLAMSLNMFSGHATPAAYHVSDNVTPCFDMFVDESVLKSKVRPFCRGAVLRGIVLDQDVYDSFIDFQEKLHQNICRRRRLVAIGTHDLSKFTPPVYYKCQPPTDIIFKPLNKDTECNALEILDIFRTGHLQEYVPLLEGNDVFPVFRDSNGHVLSMPPLINSDLTKLAVGDKPVDIFLDVTATDEHRADIVMHCLISCFSQHCKVPFTYEPVRLVYPDGSGKEPVIVPRMIDRQLSVPKATFDRVTGLQLSEEKIAECLGRMGVSVHPSTEKSDTITVTVPAIRDDVLHPVDIVDDLIVAYGINDIPEAPVVSSAIGSMLPISYRVEAVRKTLAMMALTEVHNFGLCSLSDAQLNVMRNGEALFAHISNAKSTECQAVRPALFPGLLRTAANNNMEPHPLRIFEVGRVLDMTGIQVKDGLTEKLPECHYNAAVLISSDPAPISEVHGVLDSIMLGLQQKFSLVAEKESPYFIAGQCANIVLEDGTVIGKIGVVHPSILMKENILWPTAYLEFTL